MGGIASSRSFVIEAQHRSGRAFDYVDDADQFAARGDPTSPACARNRLVSCGYVGQAARPPFQETDDASRFSIRQPPD
jgi:hypothetical protein